MRYYAFSLNTTAEQIEQNTKVKLREYCYDDTIAAVNDFMYRHVENDMAFLFYRKEGEVMLAEFAFDEQKMSLEHAFGFLCEMLDDNFGAGQIHTGPYEITMHQYVENMSESRKRRMLQGLYSRIADEIKLWITDIRYEDETNLPFVLTETIAPEDAGVLDIFDESFRRELANIEAHPITSKEDVTLAHYFLSGNSRKAEDQMVEVLVSKLFRANRLTSRRIVFISEMEPLLYNKDRFIERLIESNYGGTIVFDLTERFGTSPSDYVMTSKYLVNLFRKHSSRCLFIFTYNKEDTGFSYYMLPEIRETAIAVALKEGKGSRKAAGKFLRYCVGHSQFAKSVSEADVFMQSLKGNVFTQTEVLEAFEKFGPWCMNRKLEGMYSYDPSDEFMLDREKGQISSYEKLQNLIGLSIVKNQIDCVISSDLVEKERKSQRGNAYQTLSNHMVFAGDPGTAKTTVAKLFAGIAKERGILKSGVFVERGGMDLDGIFCVGAIREAFTAAKGGVLFIDEAYSMKCDTAVTALIQEMENKRDSVIVILAGYSERMREFMERNEGLKSRVPHWIDFPNYTTEELTQIFKLMIKERNLTVTRDAVKAASLLFDKMRVIENFGNGRYVRNLIDHAILNQSQRLMEEHGSSENIPEEKLFRITKEDISRLQDGETAVRKPGEARAELSAMIGLASAKEVILKNIAKFKLDKLFADRGLPRSAGSMHMVFTGNPGTAKTTVARLCAEILNDEKILATGNFVEVGRADLVGDHVGETARLVKKKFRQAQGGVLFIDEAYSLCDHFEGSFGDEAISTIVQEMENHREDVVVIFAGYPEPMKAFLERNPGMKSRIAFHVEFPDYSIDELCGITELMLRKKQMTITEAAMEKLRKIYEAASRKSDYGNGRFVRKILEEAEMNLANRIVDLPEKKLTQEVLTTIEECDIPDYVPAEKARFRMGFAG